VANVVFGEYKGFQANIPTFQLNFSLSLEVRSGAHIDSAIGVVEGIVQFIFPLLPVVVLISIHYFDYVRELFQAVVRECCDDFIGWQVGLIAGLVIATGPGLDWKNAFAWFQTCAKTQRIVSWRAKSLPIPINPQVSPGVARPIGSHLRFSFSGFSIFGHIQICYCHVQNINYGTSLSVFVSLAAFMSKTSRDMLPATS